MPKRDIILFVCTANVCRSPMAEGLFKKAIKNRKQLPFRIMSAGTSAWDGEKASHYAIEALKRIDIDISDHRSRLLTQALMDQTFALFCMTRNHQRFIRETLTNAPSHFYLLRELIPNNASLEVSDPFGQSIEVYEESRDCIQEAMEPILAFLEKIS